MQRRSQRHGPGCRWRCDAVDRATHRGDMRRFALFRPEKEKRHARLPRGVCMFGEPRCL
ncbi:hypothetical protein C7S15_0240 [Burkholderia cepacia]|nr:hypothetical protein [Burkholderia cepacia]